MNELDKLAYSNFLKDKSVILVGPAPTLRGKNKGDWINSFDVVVRTNGAIMLLDNEDFVKDYGSRCDILYSNVQFHREMKPFPIQAWADIFGLQFLNIKIILGSYRQDYSKIVTVRTLQHIEQRLKPIIKGLLMGPIVITDLLDFPLNSLYVTGMDFYVTKPNVFIPGDYREYYPGYLPEKIRKVADVANKGRIDPHDKKSNTSYIAHLWKNNQIEIDTTMEKIIEEIL